MVIRPLLLLGALVLPVVLACATDSCASAFTASAAAAITFCETYTTATVTATTSLPPFATACSNSSKKLSSACTCLLGTAASGTVATTTCTATAYAQITSAVASCTDIVLENISAPVSSTIDLTGLRAGSTVTFAGTTFKTFGTTEDSDFNPIEIGGTAITITGAPGHVIDGNGQAYWDGQGSNGGSSKSVISLLGDRQGTIKLIRIARPDHFIVLNKMVAGTIKDLSIQNWPVHCFDITKCNVMTLSGLTLNNSAGDAVNSISQGLPAAHNSDGFDISSTTNLVLADSTVINQDDCVAVTSGTNITVTGMTCSGGHGLSIGSVGGKSDNTVAGVTFSDSTISNSQNGCRIKTNSGTTGNITNIVYEDITLSNISIYGIDVQQDYLNGGPTGDPTNGVIIDGVTFTNVVGTALPNATDYYVLCGSGSCSGITFTDVNITGGGVGSSCNFPSTGCP
ncbi:putative endopolygalacturonase D [Lachnellula suecica]|uniref:endo-polygalacturonase n=1 Tax=Lachnellula suecica TaxID=602035 RepID=A0A8T9CJZ8_9HELO|nr:putative endopolygalacturonase D [Lachnellula suecica]